MCLKTNEIVKEQNINVSRVASEALKEKLGI